MAPSLRRRSRQPTARGRRPCSQINGSPVTAQAGQTVAVGGWGLLTLGASSGRLSAPLALRLRYSHNSVPAGTTIFIGFAAIAQPRTVTPPSRTADPPSPPQQARAQGARPPAAHVDAQARDRAVAIRLSGRRRCVVRRHVRRGTKRHLRRLAPRRRPLCAARHATRRGRDGEIDPRRLERARRLARLAHRQEGQLLLLRAHGRLFAHCPSPPARDGRPGDRFPRPHGRRIHDAAAPPLRDPSAPAPEARLRRRGQPDDVPPVVARRAPVGERDSTGGAVERARRDADAGGRSRLGRTAAGASTSGRTASPRSRRRRRCDVRSRPRGIRRSSSMHGVSPAPALPATIRFRRTSVWPSITLGVALAALAALGSFAVLRRRRSISADPPRYGRR